ncbi:MAG TPA: PAS domain-containing protein [Cyanobacteria bacterium UBA8803]|nr:PAS domain-containing protein [Cyanobacteria bacterium UBA8803]
MKTLLWGNGTVSVDGKYPDYQIDVTNRAAFDDVTRLAAWVTQAPIALLVLINAKGEQLVSQVGIEPESTAAYLAFCTQTLQQLYSQEEPLLVVRDTSADQMLATWQLANPLPPLKFYAAVRLVTPQGTIIGILSICDLVPRELSLPQKESLVALSRQAIAQLELQKKVATLEAVVSSHQQVEEFLQVSPQQLATIKIALERASIIAITDRQGRINFVNDKFCELSKYSRSEIYGVTHHLINSGYHPPEFFKQLWTTISSGKVWRGVIKDRAKDGSFYWVDTTIVPILDSEGKPHEYVSICKDITEQKRSQEERDRFWELSPDLMCVIGLDGYFQRVNPTFEKTLCYNNQELLSQPFLSFIHPEDQPATLTQWQKLANNTPSIDFENRFRCKDGSYRWLLWNSLLLAEEGVVQAIARDITKSKQAKASLLERSRLSTLEADVGAALVAHNGTLSDSLKQCTEAMVYHLHALGVGIWTVEQDSGGNLDRLSLSLQASAGQLLPAELFPQYLTSTQGLIGAIAQTRQPIYSPLSISEDNSTLKTFFSGYPLIVDSQLVGVIALHTHQPFSNVVHGVLGWVANAIAIAIDRVWAREELLSRREALLFQLASQIRNSLELDTILGAAVAEIRNLLGVESCYFVWCWPQSSPPNLSITHEARDPDSPSRLGECQFPHYAPLIEIIGNLQALQIDELAQASDLAADMRSLLKDWGIASGLVLPLKTQTGQLGAIVCSHSDRPRSWSTHEVELLQAVVDQLAIAIEHAELFAKTRASALAAQTQARQLEETLQDLKQTEALLIQTEKMSTIGQMVAGIAHEINNPVNFITGNLIHTKNYIRDLVNLLNRYQQHYPNPLPEIQDYMQDIELDFLMEDLPKMLSSMQMGADRIQEIVVSLRNFSRTDAEMKPTNIHEGIDSTLLILRNRMKPCGNHPGITTIKEYGNLPLVECYAGQLNQVFMNIISNAIDALESDTGTQPASGQPEPTIWIRTQMADNNEAVIRIRDNGLGMPPSVLNRLFDPFFTTKPVGKGTGLGLSISYQIIVEKHGGLLNCTSDVGQGTEFWIQIPITQPSS